MSSEFSKSFRRGPWLAVAVGTFLLAAASTLILVVVGHVGFKS